MMAVPPKPSFVFLKTQLNLHFPDSLRVRHTYITEFWPTE